MDHTQAGIRGPLQARPPPRAPADLVAALRAFLDRRRPLDVDSTQRLAIFVDEVTRVESWSGALRGLIDNGELVGVTLVATGSHTRDLRQGGERLPGRRGGGAELDLESVVAVHLRRAFGDRLFYWRPDERDEVDFVVGSAREPPALLEAKYVNRVERGDAAPLVKLGGGVVLTRGWRGELAEGRVYALPAAELLAAVDAPALAPSRR